MLSTLRRLVVAAAVAGAASVSIASGAEGSEISRLAAEADNLLQAGKPAAALAAFDQATDAFWRSSPLQFRTAVFVDAVSGFGQYRPRSEATFRSGETATVYLAPVGYGFLADAGSARVEMTTGLEIRTPGGLILAKTDDFGDIVWQGRTESHEVHLKVAVPLPDLKPGDYILRLTVGDRASAKSATVALPFSIIE
jgi:hypothetical protein